MTIPVIMTTSGAQTTAPSDLLNALITNVSAEVPGYTANLPGSLIEDISSTSVGALALIDQARVETINSLTPYGANEFILNQLGQIYGVQKGTTTNTSVDVTFSTPTSGANSAIGYVIPVGFTVSDGTYQYYVVTAGVISSGGSVTLSCLATQSGSWLVPVNTVTSITTSVPSPYTITCTNNLAGNPSTGDQTLDDYRAQVINAGLVQTNGFASMLTAQLGGANTQIPSYLISIQQSSSNWKIIVGGNADQYQIAYQIYYAMGAMINWLVGSLTTSRNKTISIIDGSNTYSVIYVASPVQNVTVALTWNTIATNSISDSSIIQLATSPIIFYINTIAIGAPINIFAMQEIFVSSISSIIPAYQINKINFVVTIDGSIVTPVSGYGTIAGDPEGYFYVSPTGVTITRG